MQKVVEDLVTGLDAQEIHRDPATDRAAGLVASRTWISTKKLKNHCTAVRSFCGYSKGERAAD